MPLFKTIKLASSTIFVWKITETPNELRLNIKLNQNSLDRLENMKSQSHQCGFLSIRQLLKNAGYSDFYLYYDEFGKPHLNDGKYISITHSFTFSAIIISSQKAGIDIEKQREKIILIADKFCDSELENLKQNPNNHIKKLTAIWGAKEAIFKIKNEKGISFKNHIQVQPFEIENEKTKASFNFNSNFELFDINFIEIENYILVYAFES
ncbi:MAG: 4'-phosphopantetheinyl transferase superfamily protein [Flavobacterium sp.]|nr:4'-phosphopantetheinyl transferase superfamily protein [Flavobacterium sp.]